jgi:hypothetical protein
MSTAAATAIPSNMAKTRQWSGIADLRSVSTCNPLVLMQSIVLSKRLASTFARLEFERCLAEPAPLTLSLQKRHQGPCGMERASL